MTNTSPKDNLPEDFIQKLGSVKQWLRLSTSEAQSMRERLVAYADMHATPATSVVSPYAFHFSFRFFYSRAFVASALIFILIIGTGTSVTYAAGNSLPGQALYPVKVHVAEPIEGVVIAATGGTSGTANWQNTLAERRLTEASTLAAENKLASSTQTYLENQVALHVDQSNNDSAKLAAAGDTQAASDVRTNLEARLAAHAELLALIAPRLAAAGDATTTSQVALLLSDVGHEQEAVLFDRDGEAVVASSTASSSSETGTSATTTIPYNGYHTANFQHQEAGFFAAHANILSLLPSTTATASTSLSSNKNHMHSRGLEVSSSTEATTTISETSTTTLDSGPDSPAADNSESTTTLQIGL
jgi:hypothetical protein